MGWLTQLLSRVASLAPRRNGSRARRAADARWANHAGAPQFRLEPLATRQPDGQSVRLSMTFTQTAGHDVEASLRARWRGAGTDADFATPLIDVREHTYQMKASPADPEQSRDPEIEPLHVGFELAFEWEGAERHCLWIWRWVQEPDGRWLLDATPVNTEQPAQRW